MENLTALDSNAVDISLRLVEEADVYIGIFAYRYGSRAGRFGHLHYGNGSTTAPSNWTNRG